MGEFPPFFGFFFVNVALELLFCAVSIAKRLLMIFKIVTMGIRVHPRSPEVIKVKRLRQTLIFFGKKKFLPGKFFRRKLLKITHLNRLSKKNLIFTGIFREKIFC